MQVTAGWWLVFLVACIALVVGLQFTRKVEPLTSPVHRFDTLAFPEGRELAEKYCQSCHLLPEPYLLDRKTWVTHVLPNMGSRLGISGFEGEIYPDLRTFENRHLFPSRPVMTVAEWTQILSYYWNTAPEVLPVPARPKIVLGLPGFKAEYYQRSRIGPMSTWMYVDTAAKMMYRGDGRLNQLYRYHLNFKLADSIAFGGPPVFGVKNGPDWYVLDMGVHRPSDAPRGRLLLFPDSLTPTAPRDTLFSGLTRPVHFLMKDLDRNKRPDFLISGFGDQVGEISLMMAKRRKGYTRQPLIAVPGALQTEIVYANADSLPDVLALCAQGREALYLFINQGNGKFSQRMVMEFPSSYGSTSFSLADFDGDCFPDLLLTTGDNGDYPPVMKPYHGVRVFLNKGDFSFDPAFFYPQNGVMKALALDYDLDGDMDIVSISYFPDYQNSPEESFVLLRQEAAWEFTPYSFERIPSGKWNLLISNDIDGDGDQDLLLGNSMIMAGRDPAWITARWRRGTPSFVVLRNQTRSLNAPKRPSFWARKRKTSNQEAP